jgi:hypothetical protein
VLLVSSWVEVCKVGEFLYAYVYMDLYFERAAEGKIGEEVIHPGQYLLWTRKVVSFLSQISLSAVPIGLEEHHPHLLPLVVLSNHKYIPIQKLAHSTNSDF